MVLTEYPQEDKQKDRRITKYLLLLPENIKINDAMSTVKCVGILTSGGDAPGMNAAIRG